MYKKTEECPKSEISPQSSRAEKPSYDETPKKGIQLTRLTQNMQVKSLVISLSFITQLYLFFLLSLLNTSLFFFHLPILI